MDASIRKLTRKLKELGILVLVCMIIIVLQCLMGL